MDAVAFWAKRAEQSADAEADEVVHRARRASNAAKTKRLHAASVQDSIEAQP
jgi:hypothetical protein